MKCFLCEQEILNGQETKRIRDPGDMRRKTFVHKSCWIDWGVLTIESLIKRLNDNLSKGGENETTYC